MRQDDRFWADIKGLSEAAAHAPTTKGHKGLVTELQALPGLANVKLLMTRGGDGSMYLRKHRVFEASGEVVHDDLEVLLAEQLHALGGDAGLAFRVLAERKLIVARTEIADLFLTVDSGAKEQENYIQIKLQHFCEKAHHTLFQDALYYRPKDLDDLVESARYGSDLDTEKARSLSPPRYEVVESIDVARFVALVSELDLQQRMDLSKRQYRATELSTGKSKVVAHAEVDPDFDRYPVKAKRLFADWRDSSAGRSGARFCDHWALSFNVGKFEWAGNENHEYATLVPINAFKRPLAKIDSAKGDLPSLQHKLYTLDKRVGVPFAWYFFMLHGNWVREGAGKRVIEAAEAGQSHLEDSDYQILKRWQLRPYGF